MLYMMTLAVYDSEGLATNQRLQQRKWQKALQG